MDAKQTFKQAWRELRANGRIGYTAFNAPRMRMAAIEALRERSSGDNLDGARQRLAYAVNFDGALN